MDVRRLFQVTKVQTDESVRFPLDYNEAITKRIDDKLESMGLITTPIRWDEVEGHEIPNNIEKINTTLLTTILCMYTKASCVLSTENFRTHC
jgi:hypothetical protein